MLHIQSISRLVSLVVLFSYTTTVFTFLTFPGPFPPSSPFLILGIPEVCENPIITNQQNSDELYDRMASSALAPSAVHKFQLQLMANPDFWFDGENTSSVDQVIQPNIFSYFGSKQTEDQNIYHQVLEAAANAIRNCKIRAYARFIKNCCRQKTMESIPDNSTSQPESSSTTSLPTGSPESNSTSTPSELNSTLSSTRPSELNSTLPPTESSELNSTLSPREPSGLNSTLSGKGSPELLSTLSPTEPLELNSTNSPIKASELNTTSSPTEPSGPPGLTPTTIEEPTRCISSCRGTFSSCSDTNSQIWSPDYPQFYNDTYFTCIYKIIAPIGTHVTFSLLVNELGYQARDSLTVYDGSSTTDGKQLLQVIGSQNKRDRIPSSVCANMTNTMIIEFAVSETLGGRWEGEYKIGQCST